MRTTIVSTSKLKTNKIIGIVVILSFFALALGPAIVRVIKGQSIGGILLIGFWGFFVYKVIQLIIGLKTISYDDSSVYYRKKGFEVQVPFEDIKDIEIKTLTGIYTINLYRPTQDGKKISFKMSFWYPFNYKKEDERVNELRDKIDRYKRTLPEKNYAGLTSYKI